MKKAQAEIIGLVVIVILISLGILFFAKFSLESEPTKTFFTRKELASSTMAAMMKTTISGCNSITPASLSRIELDLLEDCAEHFDQSESDLQCEKKHSCEFLQDTISSFLADTFGTWQKRYEFESILLSHPDEPLLRVVSERGDCQGRERDTSGDFFLNTDVGLVQSILYICD